MGQVKTIGIDYGSKMAGTTVIAFLENNQLVWRCSEKKKDADQMILDFVNARQPQLVAIDAPLSLPGVYTGKAGFDNYFYRVCDRETQAMSPMFLGGLTARAMKLKAQLAQVQFIEAYPVKKGKALGLEAYGFRTKTADYAEMLEVLKDLTGWGINAHDPTVTGHHMDATLALYTAQQFVEGKAASVGDPAEGLIYY